MLSIRKKLPRLLVITLSIVMTLAMVSPALASATVFHDDFDVPEDYTEFSPCAGEDIHFSGAYHVEIQTTIDAGGGFHTQFTANDNNFSGVGVSSGTQYRRVGATNQTINFSGQAPYETTFTNSFNFIGQGASNNTLLIATFHVTINANGEVTASVDNSKLVCK